MRNIENKLLVKQKKQLLILTAVSSSNSSSSRSNRCESVNLVTFGFITKQRPCYTLASVDQFLMMHAKVQNSALTKVTTNYTSRILPAFATCSRLSSLIIRFFALRYIQYTTTCIISYYSSYNLQF